MWRVPNVFNCNLNIKSDLFLLLCTFFLPPTKLWEGNAFSRVCLSVHKGKGSPSSNPYPHEDPMAVTLPDMLKLVQLDLAVQGCRPENVGKLMVGLRLKGLTLLGKN